MRAFESEITIIDGEPRSESRRAERKNGFWLCWVAAFGVSGFATGVVALCISFLTACSVLQEDRGLSIIVSSMLIGCLGALLLAAHGMDRMAAARRDGER